LLSKKSTRSLETGHLKTASPSETTKLSSNISTAYLSDESKQSFSKDISETLGFCIALALSEEASSLSRPYFFRAAKRSNLSKRRLDSALSIP